MGGGYGRHALRERRGVGGWSSCDRFDSRSAWQHDRNQSRRRSKSQFLWSDRDVATGDRSQICRKRSLSRSWRGYGGILEPDARAREVRNCESCIERMDTIFGGGHQRNDPSGGTEGRGRHQLWFGVYFGEG